MRYSRAFRQFLLATLPIHALYGQTYQTVISNGPPSNRVDIVVVGDGYTAAQINTVYPQHVMELIQYKFQGGQQPFPRYAKFFNVHQVNVVSNQSGADQPPLGIFVDTALDASYWWDGATERLLYFNTTKAQNAINAALAGSGIDIDIRYGIVNDTKYGGGGGSWAVYAGGNSSALEIALHEVGHSFGGLADEYFSSGVYTGPEPSQPNCTTSPTTGKWDRWLGYNDPTTNIGVINYYQGCGYYSNGIFRPSNNSKMRNLNRPFDAISREAFIAKIYNEVRPLDAWRSNTGTLSNPLQLWVDSVDEAVIGVEWRVNGNLIALAAEQLTLAVLGLPPGMHTVTARAYDRILDHAFTGDALDWWRLPNTNPLQQTITWTLQLTQRLGDYNGDGLFNCQDIDPLVATIAAGSHVPGFDLTGDGLVDTADLHVWLSAAGAVQLPSGASYLVGDANLDGVVDGSDFGVWNANKFTATAAWCQGDFNADGIVDGSDFGLWNGNKFQASDGMQAVPEPGGSIWLILAAWWARRNCCRTRSK